MQVWSWPYASRHYLTHPWLFFDGLWDNLRWAWQRVFKGYDERIAWSIDWYLVDAMPLWIDELIEDIKVLGGIPTEIYEDCGCDEVKAEEEWVRILDEIKSGFVAGHKMLNLEWDSLDEYSVLHGRLKNSFELLKEHFFSLWS